MQHQSAGTSVTLKESTYFWIPSASVGLHLFPIRVGISGKVLDQGFNSSVKTGIFITITDAVGCSRHPWRLAGLRQTLRKICFSRGSPGRCLDSMTSAVLISTNVLPKVTGKICVGYVRQPVHWATNTHAEKPQMAGYAGKYRADCHVSIWSLWKAGCHNFYANIYSLRKDGSGFLFKTKVFLMF